MESTRTKTRYITLSNKRIQRCDSDVQSLLYASRCLNMIDTCTLISSGNLVNPLNKIKEDIVMNIDVLFSLPDLSLFILGVLQN